MSASLTRLGYVRPQHALLRNILIPRYYDPAIEGRLDQLRASHELVSIGDLIDAEALTIHRGHDIGKMAYGGTIPYVRTSDLNSWEIVATPKQAVDQETHDEYAARQDVRAGDVFFVRDGLYLIGAHALVTAADLPLIHQSHLIRLRAAPAARVDAGLLLGLLSTPVVRLQVRSKQFTAGIIDKIEDRYRELVLPIPRGVDLGELSTRCLRIAKRRVETRERLRSLPYWIEGMIADPDQPVGREQELRAARPSILGFVMPVRDVAARVLIPRYYDPAIKEDLRRLEGRCDLVTIQELIDSEQLDVRTGVEVGKLAYGSGEVPFVRTSDLGDWELAARPKHKVSSEIYDAFQRRTDAEPGDILLVRDGTYLVGTNALLAKGDTPMLFAGGLYKLRSRDPVQLSPFLLLALLNMPIVKRQIRSKQFTRDIIDTLGRRLTEVVLPIPKDSRQRQRIADMVEGWAVERARLRREAIAIGISIEGAELDAAERALMNSEGADGAPLGPGGAAGPSYRAPRLIARRP